MLIYVLHILPCTKEMLYKWIIHYHWSDQSCFLVLTGVNNAVVNVFVQKACFSKDSLDYAFNLEFPEVRLVGKVS